MSALFPLLLRALAPAAQAGAAPEAEPLIQRGKLSAWQGSGLLSVEVGGRVVEAQPATDEVLKDGAEVWVSKTSEAWIVHGGVR